jgi:hypothetical protein
MGGAARRRAWRIAGAGLSLAGLGLGAFGLGLGYHPATTAAASDPAMFVQLVRYVDTSVPGNGIDHATFPPDWSGSGYSAEGTLGFALSTEVDGATTPLYECLVGGWDYMTSVFSNCEGTTMIGRLGYIFPASDSGTPYGLSEVQLFRCRAGADHFDSTSSDCEGQKVDGSLGYLVRLVGTPSPRCTQSTLQDNVVCYANEALQRTLSVSGGAYPWGGGKLPYVWDGGHALTPGPDLGGLDCSGFTRWIYALAGNFDFRNGSVQAGYPGDSNTTEQYYLGVNHVRIGWYVASPTTTPTPGDLVLFGTDGSDHVGIYVSPGWMIDEPQTGDYVQHDSFGATDGGGAPFAGYVHFTHV